MPARAPNLVFVFPDQMRGQALGFHEPEQISERLHVLGRR